MLLFTATVVDKYGETLARDIFRTRLEARRFGEREALACKRGVNDIKIQQWELSDNGAS